MFCQTQSLFSTKFSNESDIYWMLYIFSSEHVFPNRNSVMNSPKGHSQTWWPRKKHTILAKYKTSAMAIPWVRVHSIKIWFCCCLLSTPFTEALRYLLKLQLNISHVQSLSGMPSTDFGSYFIVMTRRLATLKAYFLLFAAKKRMFLSDFNRVKEE